MSDPGNAARRSAELPLDGDEALAMLPDWWVPTSCAAIHATEDVEAERGGSGHE